MSRPALEARALSRNVYASFRGPRCAAHAETSAGRLWRTALLGTVAVGALMFGYGRTARAQVVPGDPQCVVNGTTVTCTGDLQPGVAVTDPYVRLNVHSVTGDIAPAAGVDGIYFFSPGSIRIESDTTDGPGGPFRIETTGDGARGIEALSVGGATTVRHTGDIRTRGDDAMGIYAYGYGRTKVTHEGDLITLGLYSDGLFAFSCVGPTIVTQTGNVLTSGADSFGIHAQSCFGAVTVTQTGDVTTAGDAGLGILASSAQGDVRVTQAGRIATTGDDAQGIRTYALFGSTTITQTGDIATTGDEADGISTYAILGSTAITQTGGISTAGYEAFGIHARSALGPISVTQTGVVRTTGDRGVGIGAVGYYGAVRVTHTGTISTEGVEAYGILAAGSSVRVDSRSRITTAGAFAHGILTYSYGGDTLINHTGDVTVTGQGADAFHVELGCYGDSRVTIGAGSVITGGPDGDGVDFDCGVTNRLVNFGTVQTVGDNAIEGDDGDEIVDNRGLVIGNVNLRAGTNAFNNLAGGVFESGDVVSLGAANFLTNEGTLSPGGTGTLAATALTGNVIQTAAGVFAVDVAFGSLFADLVEATGTAEMDGSVAVNITNPGSVVPGTQRATILTATGGVSDDGISVTDTAVVDYELLFPDPNSMVLKVGVDFAPSGLNRNQTAVANSITDILLVGSADDDFTPVIAGLLSLPDIEALADAYDQLGPEGYLDLEHAALFSTLQFADGLFSCAVRDGAYAFIAEGQCNWARAAGRHVDRDPTSETIAWREDAGSFTAGTQVAIGGPWYMGAAIGYEMADFDTATGVGSDTERLQGGLSVKYDSGPYLLGAAVTAGNSWHDVTRPIAFGGFASLAESEPEIFHGTGELRAAYLIGGGQGWYAKPLVDLNATYVDLDSFVESGGGGAALIVSGNDEWVLSASPALELGAQIMDSEGTLIRHFVRGGITAFDDAEFALSSSFLAADGAAPFQTITEVDDVLFDAAAGFDLLASNGTVVRLAYEGQFADSTEVHVGSLKVSLPF